MSQIQLLDGSQVFICNPRDLVDVAYDKLGGEYSNQIEQIVNTSTEAEIYAEKRYNSDMESYEGQIEEYHDCMLEVQELLEKLEESVNESKRISREDILKQIGLAIYKLNSEL